MGKLFHSLRAALEHALTPKCFLLFPWTTVVSEDDIEWRTADDALEGNEALDPEDTVGCVI